MGCLLALPSRCGVAGVSSLSWERGVRIPRKPRSEKQVVLASADTNRTCLLSLETNPPPWLLRLFPCYISHFPSCRYGASYYETLQGQLLENRLITRDFFVGCSNTPEAAQWNGVRPSSSFAVTALRQHSSQCSSKTRKIRRLSSHRHPPKRSISSRTLLSDDAPRSWEATKTSWMKRSR